MAISLTSLFFIFKISFLPKYRVNYMYYDYINSGALGCNVIGVYRWIFPTFNFNVAMRWVGCSIGIKMYATVEARLVYLYSNCVCSVVDYKKSIGYVQITSNGALAT